jgi:hypothetical protein
MKFRKKPVVIEAIQWNGTNIHKILDFTNYCAKQVGCEIGIHTLEGVMCASLNDWIIKGIKGEFYPCKPDIFEATYEEVKE